MPKIVTYTCDICNEPAKEVLNTDYDYLCEKHHVTEELKYLKEELSSKTQWFNATWKDVLEEQIKQLETIIEGNKT